MAGKIKGLDAYLRRLARVPPAVKAAVKAQLDQEADGLVAAMKRAAPVSDLEAHPGEFRNSIHVEPHAKRELSVRIIADAKDDKGHVYAAHVEHGHKAKDGSHVAARPSFFPTYRARKRAMKRRLNAAARQAIKAL